MSIGNSVTSIGDYAFNYCYRLTSVAIPNSVKIIGNYAFDDCYGLTSLSIGNNVTNIGDHAFSLCSGLTSVTIPNSVTSIGKYAFSDCDGFTSVTIPNSVTSIGEYAFCGCKGLASVSIGNGVTSIGRRAFEECYGLKEVYVFADNPVGCNENVFYSEIYSNAILYVPRTSVSLYLSASPWSNFTSINAIPTAIEGIEAEEKEDDSPVYNLNGVMMRNTENLPNGIYIKDGKKFVVK